MNLNATSEQDPTSLDGHGIYAVSVFGVVSLLCIHPIRVPIPLSLSRAVHYRWRRLLGFESIPPANTQPTASAPASAEPASLTTEDRDAAAHSPPPSSPRSPRAHFTLDHVWSPAIGILFLLATRTIGGDQVRRGIVGDQGVEPYDVMALFISLAYIAISLDASGLLRYLALLVCLNAGSSGMRLYLLLYLFFWTAGALVGNDPVILSGTAFLVFFTRVAGISPPSAWIWAQFVAANISSAVLVSSNPTNIVIATGFGISFTTYTAYMVLPSLVSALAALCTLLLFFRNRPASEVRRSTTEWRAPDGVASSVSSSASLPRSLGGDEGEAKQRVRRATSSTDSREVQPAPPVEGTSTPPSTEYQPPLYFIPTAIIQPDVNPRAALVDRNGAIFGAVAMVATLGTLVGLSSSGSIKIYMVAVPGAAVCLARDAIHDWLSWRASEEQRQRHGWDYAHGGVELHRVSTSIAPISSPTSARISDVQRQAPPASNSSYRLPLKAIIGRIQTLARIFPTVTTVLTRLPFALLPFAFGMFILVQALANVGVINIMAKWLGVVCARGPVATAAVISTLAVVLCNIGGTNIGGTILLTKALQTATFTSQLPPASSALILKMGTYSIAFGSNVGALGGTFAASLAGLLWREGLRQGGICVSAREFALWCAVVIGPATAAGVGVLVAEVTYFHVG
ncbi:hypothetical protein BDK51DRAFT_22873 [Blyttiomyces helicus]|uniref:Citrate transporter-like domain-containing protein n=1 Tax=Blyttiomyces helicus TaxID=388810 RepID=A0A4P9WPH7_9FUNG|nr:hypothetical protein BDK51DRAFT_22873 [Blyttiomyces helicus]|eukprot:RKO93150.1 hypothetical protein BDK51DRAFT_22873 [Blyttiomyces helicus]